MKREGYKFDTDLSKHDRNTLVYEHPNITGDELKQIQSKLHNSFYETGQFRENALRSIRIDPRYEKMFNEYMQLLGNEVLT